MNVACFIVMLQFNYDVIYVEFWLEQWTSNPGYRVRVPHLTISFWWMLTEFVLISFIKPVARKTLHIHISGYVNNIIIGCTMSMMTSNFVWLLIFRA